MFPQISHDKLLPLLNIVGRILYSNASLVSQTCLFIISCLLMLFVLTNTITISIKRFKKSEFLCAFISKVKE